MAKSDHEPSEWDRRFEQVLAEYHEAVDGGSAPDARVLIAAHPDLAAQLAEYFALDEKARGTIGVLQSPTSTSNATDGPATAALLPPLEHGRAIGDYEILNVLARGGMGVVYRARQRRLKRLVALKMLPEGAGAPPDVQRRFQREAEAIAALDHPNIVPVYETGEHDGHRYLSMKLVEGPSLDDRLNDYRDNPHEAARIVAAVAGAVQHAHDRGILHRDLKPANILVDERGEPLVADFGLALLTGRDTVLTQPGLAPGTPSYMAPEQVAGARDAVGPATDVYALGAVLYALLTGAPPFRGDSKWKILHQVVSDLPSPPRSVRKSVDRELETICLKCLEKQSSARYSSANALAEDLDRWRTGRPVRARRAGPVGRAWRKARRHPRTAALAAALFGVLAIAGSAFQLQIRRHRQKSACEGTRFLAQAANEALLQ